MHSLVLQQNQEPKSLVSQKNTSIYVSQKLAIHKGIFVNSSCTAISNNETYAPVTSTVGDSSVLIGVK